MKLFIYLFIFLLYNPEGFFFFVEFVKVFHMNSQTPTPTHTRSNPQFASLVTQLHSSITRWVSQSSVHFLDVFKTRHNSQQMVLKTPHHQLYFVQAYRMILSVEHISLSFFYFFPFTPLSECHKLELLANAPSHRRIVGIIAHGVNVQHTFSHDPGREAV